MKLPGFLFTPALWRFLVLLWFGTLYWLSSQPHLPSPASFEGVDKLEHTTYFALGGVCFLLSLRLGGLARTPVVAIGMTVLFCGLVGAFDEWHQTFTPGRSGGDVWDWTADLSGGFVGAFIVLAASRWLPRREPQLQHN
ncbi:VanZ family protein [Prosthecobacter sp.]|uniref:VanZ family protein n=1 Tax=Prosthecobacter sp. TaxID=1965333 RepID=UPI00378484C9